MLTHLDGDNLGFELEQFIWKECHHLESYLSNLYFDGGSTYLNEKIKIFSINHYNNFYGFNYWFDNNLIGQIHISSLQNGQFLLYRRTYIQDKLKEQYDYFHSNGDHNYSSYSQSLPLDQFSHVMMETNSPIADFFYNYLNHQFGQVNQGLGETKAMMFAQSILQNLYQKNNLNVNALAKDQSVLTILNELIEKEKDSILNYRERNIAHKILIQKIKQIVATKSRVHHLSAKRYSLPIFLKRCKNYYQRFWLRPKQNIKGLCYKYTIGILFWFLNTVKDNLGYSIALAIYGPFTFYFITQPMNPHAMWAVGKVRNSLITLTETLSEYGQEQKPSAIKEPKNQSTKTAFTQVQKQTQKPAQAQAQTQSQSQSSAWQKPTANKILPKTSSISEAPQTLINSWFSRMDQFKAVQIRLEENMIHAVRMGRIEQIDTQFGFTTLADSLIYTLDEYESLIKENQFSQYEQEVKLINQIQLYLFQRLIQFCSDYPFILMDVSKEQKAKPIYADRVFTLITQLKSDLDQKGIQYNIPAFYNTILNKAKNYLIVKSRSNSLMQNLKSDSTLFKQNDFFDTLKFRKNVVRNWETIFLQQNKKQEAASFALGSYIWSIRHTLWNIQQIYTVKLREMTHFLNVNQDKNKMEKFHQYFNKNNHYLESLIHYMVYDFTSLHHEYAVLKNDQEIHSRKSLIKNVIWNIEYRKKLYEK